MLYRYCFIFNFYHLLKPLIKKYPKTAMLYGKSNIVIIRNVRRNSMFNCHSSLVRKKQDDSRYWHYFNKNSYRSNNQRNRKIEKHNIPLLNWLLTQYQDSNRRETVDPNILLTLVCLHNKQNQDYHIVLAYWIKLCSGYQLEHMLLPRVQVLKRKPPQIWFPQISAYSRNIDWNWNYFFRASFTVVPVVV